MTGGARCHKWALGVTPADAYRLFKVAFCELKGSDILALLWRTAIMRRHGGLTQIGQAGINIPVIGIDHGIGQSLLQQRNRTRNVLGRGAGCRQLVR